MIPDKGLQPLVLIFRNIHILIYYPKFLMEEEIQKLLYHITWVTHNSRVSERMKKYSKNKGLQPLVLNIEQEIEITSYISKILKEDNLKLAAYNICADHIHLILFSDETKRDNIVRKLKGKSTQLYKDSRSIKEQFSLWAQKYNYTIILSDEQLSNAVEYIKCNRFKHNLPENSELQKIIDEMITPFDKLL